MEKVAQLLSIFAFGFIPIIYFIMAVALYFKNIQSKRNLKAIAFLSPFVLTAIFGILLMLFFGFNFEDNLVTGMLLICSLPAAAIGATVFHVGLIKGTWLYQFSRILGYTVVAAVLINIIVFISQSI